MNIYTNPPCSRTSRTERNHLHRVQMIRFKRKIIVSQSLVFFK
nr:MAG TPA: hypothetical protein [Caudoviricetes sp.]